MFDKVYIKKIKDNKKGRQYRQVLNETFELLEAEMENIRNNKPSEWPPSLLQDLVYPEIKELYDYAKEGKAPLGTRIKRFRRLMSVYFMLDTLENFKDTPLGRKISELGDIYCTL